MSGVAEGTGDVPGDGEGVTTAFVGGFKGAGLNRPSMYAPANPAAPRKNKTTTAIPVITKGEKNERFGGCDSTKMFPPV